MFQTTIQTIPLQFETDQTVFSPNSIDKGTLAMLSIAEIHPGDKILDLGCGYGVVGIYAAKLSEANEVILSDNSEAALKLAQRNAELNQITNYKIIKSDGLKQITDSSFTLILSNPPYHTDFSVAKAFIEHGFQKLVLGGRMVMVTKRLDWYKNKLEAIFGGVMVTQKDGYYVFLSEKRSFSHHKKIKPEKSMSKKLQRKYSHSSKQDSTKDIC